MSVRHSFSISNRPSSPVQVAARFAGLGLYWLITVGLMVSVGRLHSLGCGGQWDLSPMMLASSLASMGAYALLGSLIVIYRPENRIAQICLLCALTLGLTMLTSLGLPCGLAAPEPWAGLPYLAWGAYTFAPFIGVLPQFVLLPLLYPSGRFLSPRWARVTVAGILLCLISSLALSFLPDFRRHNGVTFSLDLDNPFGIAGLPEWWHPLLMSTSVISLTGLCFLGMAAVVVRYRRSVGDERQQMKWLAYFLVTVVVVQLLGFELPGNLYYPDLFYTIWYDLIILAVQLGFPLTVAIAVFKYRLYDIDLIIHRTLVFGALTALVVVTYAVIVSTLGWLLHAPDNFMASLAAAGVVAVIFQPARLWLQRQVSRRLFGARDDPAEVLTRLTDQMGVADSGVSLLASLVTTIGTSLKLPYVAVWIRNGEGELELAAATGTQPSEVEEMPLMHQQEVIGRLVVAPRVQGEPLATADRTLLIAVARLVATTARTVQLTDEVQEARIRTVSAREEERRRLRRDLHDGLGPVLAGQGLKLAAARQLLRERPEVAERLLDEVMNQSESTVSEVRRLVYALRPPTLDELGLVEAIREHVDAVGAGVRLQVTVDAPECLPEIPAALEVAAFRVVQEALSNVIRHAQARHCTITLQMNGSLDVKVTDDGVGLSDAARRGVGLLSMQERAAEVGGVCRVENGEQGGVRVWLTLPGT